MLSALLSLVGSMGAISVLAGVVSGVIFLVDSVLHWASLQRSSLDPTWPGTSTAAHATRALDSGAANPGNETLPVDGDGTGNGTASAVRVTDDNNWIPLTTPTTPAGITGGRLPVLQTLRTLQNLDVKLRSSESSRRSRLGAGDGSSRRDMGMADDAHDVHDVHDVPDGPAGVRQLMERLVESLVSGGLDDVALRPKDPHPQYGRIYKRHQPRLRSALTSLSYSLQMAMAQKPLEECETPGRAHAQLRALILDLAKDVAALDRHPGHVEHIDVNGLDEEDLSSRAYEDILATAIVNKVMERTSKHIKRNNNNNNNFISSLEVRVGSVDDSAESCTSSFTTESWTGSGSSHLDHSLEDADSDPLSLMIEECIEEVTTITATSSSSSAASSLDERSEGEDEVRQVPVVRRRRKRSSRRRGSGGAPLSGPPSLPLSFDKQRVPFPELGVDIVDAEWSAAESDVSEAADGQRNGLYAEGWRGPQANGGDEVDGPRVANGEAGGTDEDGPASCLELVTPLQSWEDNWLFQSKRVRKPAAQYAHHPVPVPMLVPNPSEDFRALIGDVDAEETSDLSECSDDALEEVVLAGMRPDGAAADGSDIFSEDLSLSEATSRPHLDGLAETCNLELLRRAARAPALSTAPAPKAQRTDRSANMESPLASPERMSPTGRTSTPTSPRTSPPGRRSPVDLAGRWARDQDAEMTIVYDTPTRREAPARAKLPVKASPPPSAAIEPQQAVAVEPDTHTAAAETYSTPSRVEQEDTDSPAATASTPDEDDPSDPEQEVPQHHVNGRLSPVTNGHVDSDMFTPPRPGTIAEREHRKWLEATPLANNPYSPENIQRRLQQRANQTAPVNLPPILSASKTPHGPGSLPAPGDASLHIALRVDPDPKKYGRDFYINSRDSEHSERPSAGLRRAHSVTAVDRRGSLLETPIAPWSSAVRTNGDGGSEETSMHALQHSPSVKELARQFVHQEQQHPQPLSRTKTPDASSRVVIVSKNGAGGADAKQDKRAVRQVHSLTARSMSREFREGLRHLSSAPPAAPAARPGVSVPPSAGEGEQPDQPSGPSGRPDPEGARQPADLE